MAMNTGQVPDTAVARTRILVVDDHPPFAEGLASLIRQQADMDVVGLAGDGLEAVSLAGELRPDVIVMDVAMPRMNGIEATKEIKKSLPRTAVLVLSAYGYEPYVLFAFEAGAGGYLLKNAPMAELLTAIRSMLSGETVLDRAVSQKLIRSLVKSGGGTNLNGRLGPKEIELLKLGARGVSNKEIARQLSIGERTVQANFSNIFVKLGVGSRMEAVLRAVKEGWLTADDLP